MVGIVRHCNFYVSSCGTLTSTTTLVDVAAASGAAPTAAVLLGDIAVTHLKASGQLVMRPHVDETQSRCHRCSQPDPRVPHVRGVSPGSRYRLQGLAGKTPVRLLSWYHFLFYFRIAYPALGWTLW